MLFFNNLLKSILENKATYMLKPTHVSYRQVEQFNWFVYPCWSNVIGLK